MFNFADFNSRVCVSWSGGKDSTTAVFKYIELGFRDITAVCYVPMFNDSIPLIRKPVYDYLVFMKSYFESLGVKVVFLHGLSYCDYVLKKITRGKNPRLYQGFPLFFRGACSFNRDSKTPTISKFFKNNCFDCIDIGFAYLEEGRKQLKDKEVSILRYLKITEKDCFRYLISKNMLSPSYLLSTRDGCALCPNARSSERVAWLDDYPSAFSILLHLQKCSTSVGFYPLRGKRQFIETNDCLSFSGQMLLDCIGYKIN